MPLNSPASQLPAFGQADLSNCEREQIHLAGSIQPHGALFVVSEPQHQIVQTSINAAAFIGLPGEVLGLPVTDVLGDLWKTIEPHLSEPLTAVPLASRCRVGRPAREFDSLIHRLPGGGLVVELEPAAARVDLSQAMEGALDTILAAASLQALADQTARIFRQITGYDRVMVYRFDDEGHGEVFAEQREPHLEAYLGNRYPASDIPQIARRLYLRNRVRLLVDAGYTPVPLNPMLCPLTGRDLDMSMCHLRSMSPIHVQYLQNMGVAATLVVSLVVGGKLWGLIACHHYSARVVHYEVRAVSELLAESIGTRIAALESFLQARAELSVRRLEQRMVEAISRDGDWKSALFDGSRSLLKPVSATGAALLFEGEVYTAGEVPGTPQLLEIGRWLDMRRRNGVISTTSLGLDEPDFAPIIPVASGLLAAPISQSPGEYLMWFRTERMRTVTWGGDPYKAVVIGNDPSQLSPRRSFAQWHQLVEGTSDPWTPADLSSARLIGDSVADVVLQFRSVRMLIAQDQLAQVSRRVQVSNQPVLIADSTGRIVLANDAFEQLLPEAVHLRWIKELAPFSSEPATTRRDLEELLRNHTAWRGEIRLRKDGGEGTAFMVRADPVFAAADRVLGFVLLLNDLTERKEAEAARKRFQENVIGRQHVASLRLHPKAGRQYQNLLSSVVGNAQLAALEITDGVDPTHMPAMLESVQNSVLRTEQLLQFLLWHAGDD